MEGATHFFYQRKQRTFGSYFSPVRTINEMEDPLIKSLISQGLIVAIIKIKLKATIVQ